MPPFPVLSVLFAGTGSVSVAVAVAALSNAPAALIVAVTVIVAFAPEARLTIVHGSVTQAPLTVAIVRFVGGSPADALEFTRLMGRITLARNPSYALPPLGFIGTPTGIDARRVVDSGIAPVINTGIAHRQAGVGQIGAGIARAPLACFSSAIAGLADGLGSADRPWTEA